jgi:hypothetical protein
VEPGAGGEELFERVERVDAPLGCGVEVGPDAGEVGESLQGSPGAAGGALLDLHRSYGSFRCVVGVIRPDTSHHDQDPDGKIKPPRRSTNRRQLNSYLAAIPD